MKWKKKNGAIKQITMFILAKQNRKLTKAGNSLCSQRRFLCFKVYLEFALVLKINILFIKVTDSVASSFLRF